MASNSMTRKKSIQSIVDALAAHVCCEDAHVQLLPSPDVSVYELHPPFSHYPADIILGFANPGATPTHVTIEVVSPEGVCACRHASWLNKEDVIVPALMGTTMLPMVAMPDGWSLNVGVCGQVTAVCAHLRDHVVMDAALSTFQLPRPLAFPHPTASTPPFVAGLLARSEPCAEHAVQLPDLDRALELGIRSAAASAREAGRQLSIFQELMESAWAPRRVIAGSADLDS